MGWSWALTRSWSLIQINTVSVGCEKNPTFRDATAGFSFHDSASYCLKIYFNQSETLPMPDPGTVASSEEISALVPPSSFRSETSCGVAKCRLFSQAKTSMSLRLRL